MGAARLCQFGLHSQSLEVALGDCQLPFPKADAGSRVDIHLAIDQLAIGNRQSAIYKQAVVRLKVQ